MHVWRVSIYINIEYCCIPFSPDYEYSEMLIVTHPASGMHKNLKGHSKNHTHVSQGHMSIFSIKNMLQCTQQIHRGYEFSANQWKQVFFFFLPPTISRWQSTHAFFVSEQFNFVIKVSEIYIQYFIKNELHRIGFKVGVRWF